MKVAMWEHLTLNNYVFDVAKFTTLTPLPLIFSCQLILLAVGFKTYDRPSFSIKII